MVKDYGGSLGLMEHCFDRLWPLMRSITGEGVRRTHDILGELLPLRRLEIPSGTRVFDWVVPEEWEVREAWLEGPDGTRILDIRDNTLHLVNYSEGFRGELDLDALQEHLHSIPEIPEAIPYLTSYYARNWGFCLTHRQRQGLKPGRYTVHIDARHFPGTMTMSEAVLPGETDREILFSTYTCHPSMANNELSGPLVAAFLYGRLAAMPTRRYTYRFIFGPETIGAIAYLAQNGEHLKKRLEAGLVLSCIGDAGPFTFKRSRRASASIDRVCASVLSARGNGARCLDFWPGGSDERQYCSPGFNLPVGVLSRSIFAAYPEYHTSLDNKGLLSFEAMQEAVELCFEITQVFEENRVYERTDPHCEPFLTRYDLQEAIGARRDPAASKKAMQWLLNLADGSNDILAMAERSGLAFSVLAGQVATLVRAGLLRPADKVKE